MGHSKMRLLIELTQILAVTAKCPSYFRDMDVSTGCWSYDPEADKCVITNPTCGALQCDSNQMTSYMRPEIFGFTKWDIERIESGHKKLIANGKDGKLGQRNAPFQGPYRFEFV